MPRRSRTRARVPDAHGREPDLGFGRHLYPPWGVDGGRDGSPNYVEVVRRTGPERFGKVARYPLREGDLVRLSRARGAARATRGA